MDAVALDAITDVTTLRTLVREQIDVITQREAALAQHAGTIAQRDRTIHARDLKIDKLTYELACLRRMRFGAKAEALSAVQRELFEESLAADIAALDAQLQDLAHPSSAVRRVSG